MEAPISPPSDLPMTTPHADLAPVAAAAARVHDALGQVLVGQGDRIELLLAALLADGHVLIEGVPGVAKTLTARLLARVLDVSFARIQFTPDLMPSDVTGTSVFNPQDAAFSFRPGPIFAHLVLIDEINRAPAKTQAALFEVMEERQVTVDGTTHPLAPPFMVVATQNPLEHEGTYRLPEAQLDRFLFKIVVGFPSLDEEVEILERHERGNLMLAVNDVPRVLTAEALAGLRAAARAVHAEPVLRTYIAQIVQETRRHPALDLGGSPRASVGILMAGKALAALRGRDFLIPDDVQAVAAPVLRHRIRLTPDQEMDGKTPDDVIADVLQRVAVPR